MKTGLLGFPIEHTLSTVMHNSAYQFMGLSFTYAAHSVTPERLQQAVEGIRALGYRGVNITTPHKVSVIKFLDDIDDEAAEIGAVNTILCENDQLIGYNTDGIGYIRSFEEELQIDLAGQRILLLGAGGAARAVAVSLARKGVERIHIFDQKEASAQELARLLSSRIESQTISMETLQKKGLAETDILINATPVGLWPHVENLPLSAHYLHSELIVSDLIYNPVETALQIEARKVGAKLHHGIGMLVHQGALSFQLWTRQQAPVDVMKKTVLNELRHARH